MFYIYTQIYMYIQMYIQIYVYKRYMYVVYTGYYTYV